MRLLADSKEITSTFNRLLAQSQSLSFAVAWASFGFDSCNKLLKAKKKINRGVVGIHFFQTDSRFISEFNGDKRVKFITNPSGVFHPKIYLFKKLNGNQSALIGSANFTLGAFSKNSEVVLHIEAGDDGAAALYAKLETLMEDYFKWPSARYFDEIDLERYNYFKNRFKKPLDKAQDLFGDKSAKKNLIDIELLGMSWDDFFSQISENQNELNERLEVLHEANALFNKFGSLEAMPIECRQGIGGFIHSNDVHWSWFGSMTGAGTFKNLINKAPHQLSEAVERIPLIGPVQRTHYDDFVDAYIKAYPRKNKAHVRHGLGTASRLLAMKRPDYFLCLDSANKRGISKALGVSINNHDYDSYWESVIERILESKWWNTVRPTGSTVGKVWDGRVAFLDTIFYEPDSRT